MPDECPPSVIFIPGVTAGLLLVKKSGRLMQLTHSQARTNDRRTQLNPTQPVNQQIYRILRRELSIA